MKSFSTLFSVVILMLFQACSPPDSSVKYAITIADGLIEAPMDGRLMLLISSNDAAEPRFQVSDNPGTQLVYGMDVDGMTAGKALVFDNESFGYPLEHLSDLPAGDYYVQALLHKYETFNLSTGHTVKLPMDDGEGQHWNTSPGNLLSTPKKIFIGPGEKISIEMTEIIPPIDPPQDTKYIKHVKMKSEKLSKFWGRDIYLGANLLLPEGFDEHP